MVIDATDGPGRGQTICDLRGQKRGYPAQPGAHVRVLLDGPTDLGPALVRQIASL